jgi:hypothetical protein
MLPAETPERVRGRVFASMDVLWLGDRFISLAAGGLLADRYGIQVVYYLGGLLLLAAAAAGVWTGRQSPDQRATSTRRVRLESLSSVDDDGSGHRRSN